MRHFKIKYRFLLFVVASFLLLILANGCGKPAECKVDADCGKRTCSSASCADNECTYNTVQNCCGNKIKDSIEDGKLGNSCTCPQDYGTCAGKAEIQAGGRTYDAQYVQYFCENAECVLGVPPEDIRPVTLLDEKDFGLFTLETTVTYNEPFDAAKDTFAFRISLKDYKEGIVLPVNLNKLLLKNGEILFGEKEVKLALGKIGDTVTVNVPLDYRLEQVEEAGGLTYQMNYEYTQKVKDERLQDGSYSYKDELVRDDYQKRFTTKITFVNP
ncbi:hypothetical protein HYU50_04660 [Candidatus Woesearchaeota archaeon]|nr:hypothetical protein [Candidatus Woesearchaeota archaeon]